MKNRKNRKTQKLFAAVGVGALLLVLTVSGCKRKNENTEISVPEESQAIQTIVEWKGKSYTYNTDLINILFLGIDKSEPVRDDNIPGEAGQSDCIMILSLDQQTKEARILQLNRNTMTELDIYDFSGNYLRSVEGQLALQFAYDIGGKSSCWAVKKTVQELLYGLEIDGWFAMDVAGIPEINDALGGVDVTMKEDYSAIDPSFTKDSTVHLTGKLAQKFVQYRDTETFNSVEDRMHRQVDYITAMIGSMHLSGAEKLYDVISPYLDTYVITDLNAEQLNSLVTYQYLTDEVQYLPGEMVQGEVYEEYYIDEEQLQDLLIQIFYEEVDE